jgi:hypothetical protein
LARINGLGVFVPFFVTIVALLFLPTAFRPADDLASWQAGQSSSGKPFLLFSLTPATGGSASS